MTAEPEILLRDPQLHPIWEKVRTGQRLTGADGKTLMCTPDLLGVAQMADWVKRQRHGPCAYFVINRYINPTNICVLSCRFCDFARRKGDPDAYELDLDTILRLIEPGTREVHIVGGHHPDWPFEYYEEMIRAIRSRFPDIGIKAFTAAEIDYFWRRWKIPPDESLARLKAAGLDLLPGGGAEVFSDRLHRLLYPGKAGPRRWLEIHRLAHQLGLRSNATILFGHIETVEERIQHLLLLRELQDETGGFLNFIPLTYQPGRTRLVHRPAAITEELRMIAVARLMLDNFPHIQAYWVTMGATAASLGLKYGADDLNGTMGEEKIMHAAGAPSPVALSRQRLIQLIRPSGYLPVERDARFQIVRIYGEAPHAPASGSVSVSEHDSVPPAARV